MPIFVWNPRDSKQTKAKLYSNIDLSEPFVARIWGLVDILEATEHENKEEIRSAILCVLIEGLLPAHISLKNIMEHTDGIAESNKQKDYLDLYNHIWAAYKDRMPKIFKNSNFDIGFLFQDDKKFKQGLTRLNLNFPTLGENFFKLITWSRATWQKSIVTIRNDYSQHRKISIETIEHFFTPKNAETAFSNTWRVIESIVLHFLMLKLPNKGIKIVEIPKEQRDRTMPKKYGIAIEVSK